MKPFDLIFSLGPLCIILCLSWVLLEQIVNMEVSLQRQKFWEESCLLVAGVLVETYLEVVCRWWRKPTFNLQLVSSPWFVAYSECMANWSGSGAPCWMPAEAHIAAAGASILVIIITTKLNQLTLTSVRWTYHVIICYRHPLKVCCMWLCVIKTCFGILYALPLQCSTLCSNIIEILYSCKWRCVLLLILSRVVCSVY